MQFDFESRAIRHDQWRHTILFQVDLNRSNIANLKNIRWDQVTLSED